MNERITPVDSIGYHRLRGRDPYYDEQYGEDANGEMGYEEIDEQDDQLYDEGDDLPAAMHLQTTSFEQFRHFVDRMAFTLQSFIASSLKFQESSLLASSTFLPQLIQQNPQHRAACATYQAIQKLASSISSMPPSMKTHFSSEMANYIEHANISAQFMDALRYSASVSYSTAEKFLQVAADVSCGKRYFSYTQAVDSEGNPLGAWHTQRRRHPLMGGGGAGGFNKTPASAVVIELESFALDCLRQFLDDFVMQRIKDFQQQQQQQQQRQKQGGKTNVQASNMFPSIVVDIFKDGDALTKTLSVVVENVLQKYAKVYASQVPTAMELQQADGGAMRVSTVAFLGLETNKQYAERRVANLVNEQVRGLFVQTHDTIHMLQSGLRKRDKRLRHRMRREQKRRDRQRRHQSANRRDGSYDNYYQGPMYQPQYTGAGGDVNQQQQQQQQQLNNGAYYPMLPQPMMTPAEWYDRYYRTSSSRRRRHREGKSGQSGRRSSNSRRSSRRHSDNDRRGGGSSRKHRSRGQHRDDYDDTLERSIDYDRRGRESSRRRYDDRGERQNGEQYRRRDDRRHRRRHTEQTQSSTFSDYTDMM